MRISRPFGVRTETKREIAKKYFLIFEGAETEKKYFFGINENKEMLGINSLIEIVPILRSYNEQSWSNPQKILNKLIEHIELMNGKVPKVENLCDMVIDWAYEKGIINENGLYTLETLKDELQKNVVVDGGICDKKKILKVAFDFLSQKLRVHNSIEQIEEYVNMQFVTYDADYDKVCLIVDRDRKSFKEEQYDYVVRVCEEKRYNLYVSNPCFELWLLLHYDEVLQIDREKLFTNPREKPKAKKRFIENQLSRLMGGYKKNSLQFNKISDKVFNAIKNEEQFCEDVKDLKNELGCNLGLLIKEMMQKE